MKPSQLLWCWKCCSFSLKFHDGLSYLELLCSQRKFCEVWTRGPSWNWHPCFCIRPPVGLVFFCVAQWQLYPSSLFYCHYVSWFCEMLVQCAVVVLHIRLNVSNSVVCFSHSFVIFHISISKYLAKLKLISVISVYNIKLQTFVAAEYNKIFKFQAGIFYC